MDRVDWISLAVESPYLTAIYATATALGVIWAFSWIGQRWLEPQRLRSVYVRRPPRRLRESECKSAELEKYRSGEVDAVGPANHLWEFAVLCEDAYRPQNVALSDLDAEPAERLGLALQAGWRELPVALPDDEGAKSGLAFRVWYKLGCTKTITPALGRGAFFGAKLRRSTAVAVVFRGTNSREWADWRANLRWVLRCFPRRGKDQYEIVERQVGPALKAALDQLGQERDLGEVSVVATGHSLGGGLAEHLALTLEGPRVTQVFQFNTSPVTGWSSVSDKRLRDTNSEKLRVFRVFEHGEVLAYLRLLLSGAFGLGSRSTRLVWTFRFNCMKSSRAIASHSMTNLSKHLVEFRLFPPIRPMQDSERVQQLQLIYDYIKFHIGLYVATPPLIAVIAYGVGVPNDHRNFVAGMVTMLGLFVLAGAHAAWFMGTHVNRKWRGTISKSLKRRRSSPFDVLCTTGCIGLA